MGVRRENKTLSNEIKDIMDQISEGGRSIHEIDKIRKRLEAEKMELEAALSEAEGALEQEENKVLRGSLELTQVKQEIERRIAQKEKLDSDVIDLGIALEHANAANAESQRNISLIQGNIRGVQKRFEEESRAKAAATDSLISADRRANANQNALEEARTLLEQAEAGMSEDKAQRAMVDAARLAD